MVMTEGVPVYRANWGKWEKVKSWGLAGRRVQELLDFHSGGFEPQNIKWWILGQGCQESA